MKKEDIEYYINLYNKTYLSNNNMPAAMDIFISLDDMTLDNVKYLFYRYRVSIDVFLKSGNIKFRIRYPDEFYDDFIEEIFTESERAIKKLLE